MCDKECDIQICGVVSLFNDFTAFQLNMEYVVHYIKKNYFNILLKGQS
jgi:hypothetical protein